MSIKVYLTAILDNYMFRPLLAIFRLSSRELKVPLYIYINIYIYIYIYIVRARDGEISTSGLCCVISNFYVECGGMLWLQAR
jgi:hypothetical protein